jgi:hypothetical protein
MKVSILPLAAFALVAPAFAQGLPQGLPPFDRTDEFYRANGIDPAAIQGRPVAANANSVVDDRENGPNYNNIRVRSYAGSYDHSGHPVFFYVTGLVRLNAFLNNAAGQRALQIAESYDVYEFPRSTNAQYAVFPKRQDNLTDLRNGYFSNNPLGIWRIKLVRFTPAAFNTDEGRRRLADIAEDNGTDLDGTPLIRTLSEIENLASRGLVTIEIPPMDGTALRWFMCPVIEHPEGGAITHDGTLGVTNIPAAQEFRTLFESLRMPPPPPPPTGGRSGEACSPDFNGDGDAGTDQDIEAFFSCLAGDCCTTCLSADFNADGDTGTDQDIESFFRVLAGGGC